MFSWNTHVCHLLLQRSAAQVLPVHRVQVQSILILQTWNTKRIGLHGHKNMCREKRNWIVFDTFSVALPSMQVCTTRCPSQDTARCMMDMGRELSHGGRRQRMYWPLRTVWIITVPSCDTQMHKFLWFYFFSSFKSAKKIWSFFRHFGWFYGSTFKNSICKLALWWLVNTMPLLGCWILNRCEKWTVTASQFHPKYYSKLELACLKS